MRSQFKKYLMVALVATVAITTVTAQAAPKLLNIISDEELIINPEISVVTPVVDLTPLPEPAPVVGRRMMSPAGVGIGSITMNALTHVGDTYTATGTWSPTPVCYSSKYQFDIQIIDQANSNAILATIDPAPCAGVWSGAPDDKQAGGNWPGNLPSVQSGNTFTLTPGDHTICALLRHSTPTGHDTAISNCERVGITPPPQCSSPLDYVDNNGNAGPDGQIGLSDAVKFTEFYMSGVLQADVNGNGGVDYGDYLCAKPYIANGTPYDCRLNCQPVCGDNKIDENLGEQCDDGNNIDNDNCNNKCQLTYDFEKCVIQNADFIAPFGLIDLSDATIFTGYYENQPDDRADVNNDGLVNNNDYLCVNQFVSIGATYALPTVAPLSGPAVSPINYDLNIPAIVKPLVNYTPVTPVLTESKIENSVAKNAVNVMLVKLKGIILSVRLW